MILKVTAFCKGFHSLHLWLNPDKAIKKMKNSFQQCGVFLGGNKTYHLRQSWFHNFKKFPPQFRFFLFCFGDRCWIQKFYVRQTMNCVAPWQETELMTEANSKERKRKRENTYSDDSHFHQSRGPSVD